MTSAAIRKKKTRKMMKRKGITSLDLLFRKSAQEITCRQKEGSLTILRSRVTSSLPLLCKAQKMTSTPIITNMKAGKIFT